VASHFSSIGLPLRSEADLDALTERTGPLAEPVDTDRGTYFRWTDPSGAEMWIQVGTGNELLGVSPHFVGKSVVRVRVTARADADSPSPLDGRFHGWADPPAAETGGADGAYPFLFDAPDAARYDALELPAVVTVQVAAFAHEVETFASLDAYNAAQTGAVKFASQSFIPSGLFDPSGEAGPARAEAIFTGHVIEAERRTNRLTGAEFVWCLVDSLGGSFDVVIDPELVPDVPTVGGVVQGSFWLSGRITGA
jgi:hypothetical protein